MKEKQSFRHVIIERDYNDIVIIINKMDNTHYAEANSLMSFIGHDEFMDVVFELTGLFTHIPKKQIIGFSNLWFPWEIITCIDIKHIATYIKRTNSENLKHFMSIYESALK
jgi:hypothetical protein